MTGQVSDKGGSDFVPEKTACPICHVRFGNLIRHLKRNVRCKLAIGQKYPVILESTPEDFLRGG